MNATVRSILILLASLLSAGVSSNAQSLFDIDYGGSRSHPFDLIHTALDVRFDQRAKKVVGTVRHTIRSLALSLDSIRLDADAPMLFSRITVDGVGAGYRRHDSELVIAVGARRYGDTFTVAIDYNVVPRKGLYFIQPDSLAADRRRQVWTQGEPDENRGWIPLYDYPNDRATSEVTVTVENGWEVLSNGVLESIRRNEDGSSTWHWNQGRPHAGYLIMLAAGDYLITRDTVDGIPLEYWTYPEHPERVKTTFGRTPDVMRYLKSLIGYPYPWEKYGQVVIADFMYGGMENTSATTLNDMVLVDQRGFLDYNPDEVIAHEAAHQWFGDLVTNRSWGHLWLHESYATYLASRYMGHRYGADVFAREMYDADKRAAGSDERNGRDPISGGQGMTENIYDRGSRVLNMLSRVVGDSLFWLSSREFLRRHEYGLVETNDLKIAFEDVTGLNLDWFFEQWIYKGGMPTYNVGWEQRDDSLYLYVKQTQVVDSLTGLFRMPVVVEAHLDNAIVADTIWVTRASDTFALALSKRPRFVIFDAGNTVLKRLEFPRSQEELTAQLNAPRTIDRLLAVDALVRRDSLEGKEKSAVTALAKRYYMEPFPTIREKIVEGIASFGGDEAKGVVRRALGDPDARVRRAAVENSYLIEKGERAGALKPLLTDSSYGVIGATLAMMAATDTTGLVPYFASIKGMKGRRDRIAEAWLNAVAVGRIGPLADDVVDYTSPTFDEDTRSKAYMVLSDLDVTTLKVRRAIERGVIDTVDLIRSSAAAAARARRTDADMRAGLEKIRDASTGEPRRLVESILNDEENDE